MSVGRAGSCCPVRWINDSALQRIRPPRGAGGVLVWRGAVKNGTAGAGEWRERFCVAQCARVMLPDHCAGTHQGIFNESHSMLWALLSLL